MILPREIRAEGLAGSNPLIIEVISHHVHFSVEATSIAAHECATAVGCLGSLAHELIVAAGFFSFERIPTNSAPVGILA